MSDASKRTIEVDSHHTHVYCYGGTPSGRRMGGASVGLPSALHENRADQF